MRKDHIRLVILEWIMVFSPLIFLTYVLTVRRIRKHEGDVICNLITENVKLRMKKEPPARSATVKKGAGGRKHKK